MEKIQATSDDDIVITGLSGRFPKSDNLDELMYHLYNGINMATEDETRWAKDTWVCPLITGKVASYDKFDNEFFGYSTNQAETIDPEERTQLEVTYEAIVDAGIDPYSLAGSNTGLFKGDCFNHTSILKVDPFFPVKEPHNIITRTMHHYDLKGPFFHVDTACASSFCGFHEAALAIKYNRCDAAIVIGTNTVFDPFISYQMNNLTFLSPTGTCRSLSDDANGYLRSEANVAIVLQRRSVAKRVYATVMNTVSNCDGYKEEGITFPGRATQEKLMKQAYAEIGMDPKSIKYIEAHATGTKAGDPVEMTAIYNTYCDESRKDPLYVGCIKSNLGHTEGSSGLCALTKAIISFQNQMIPPNINFRKPNEKLPGISTGQVVPVLRPTPFDGDFCALNSFGFGGANVHSILRKERSNHKMSDASLKGPRIVGVRGRTKESVNYIYDYIRKNKKNQTPEFLYLLDRYACAGGQMPFRGYFLLDKSSGKVEFSQVETQEAKKQQVSLVFVHSPDANNNWEQFDRQLLQLEPFAASFEKSIQMASKMKVDLREVIKGNPQNETEEILLTTATLLALVDTLKAVGVRADRINGQSLGELACAYWFGEITAEEAIITAHCSDAMSDNGSSKKEKFRQLLSKLNKNSKWNSINSEITNKDDSLTIEVSVTGLSTSNSHNKSLTETLNALGQLYMNGSRLQFDKLYPAVKFPLPSNVPSLSPLIKWDHDFTHSMHVVMPHLGKNQFTTHFKTMGYFINPKSSEETFYLGHKVDGRLLFPAVGYMALAYQTLGRLSNRSASDFNVEFRDVCFLRATIMNPEKEIVFNCRIDELTGRFEVRERDMMVVCGFINEAPDFDGQLPHYLPEKSADDIFEIKQKDIYKEFRVRGYDYEDYFCPVTSLTSDGKVGRVCWRDTVSKQIRENITTYSGFGSSEWLRRWLVFTDGMMQLMLGSEKMFGRGLFVPTKLGFCRVNPSALKQNIENSPTIEDLLTQDTASVVECYGSSFEESVYTAGLQIVGLKTSLLKRQKDPVLTNKVEFNPLNEEIVIEDLVNNPPANFDDERCYPVRLIDSILQYITENWITKKTTGKFLEITPTAFNLSSNFDKLASDGVYSDIFSLKYSVMTDAPAADVTGTISQVMNTSAKLDDQSQDVVIWRNFYSCDAAAEEETMKKVFTALADRGYFLAFTSSSKSSSMKSLAVKEGLHFIFEKKLKMDDDLSALLFRKLTTPLKEEDQKVIAIGLDDFEWVCDMKDMMEEMKDQDGARIWLIPKSGEEYFDQEIAGILGVTKSLRFEAGGDKIRCIIDFRLKDTVDFSNDDYSFLLKQDTTFNVFDKAGKCWGSFNNYVTDIDEATGETPKDVYLKPQKPGDLSSLAWAESEIPYSPESELIDVYYAPLNFKDVMYASGNLPIDLIYGVPPEVQKDSLLGVEFAGRDHNGRRVFGTLMYKAMATRVAVSKEDFVFPVPDGWTMEEASTVPAVYLTSLYALEIHGCILPGESILIHAGAGGVGLSALNICTHKKMNVFVTVGSQEKKDYLLKEFPTLKVEQIFNSRSAQFEDDILRATDGKGVDVILNCLAGSLQQAGLRCLAENGRFLEIGKTDFLRDSPLNHTDYGMNQSFIGVCLDRVFKARIGKIWDYPRLEKDRKRLYDLLSKGLTEGYVRPLKSNLFEMSQAEDAFRYMATGKHIGKCVIKIRDENENIISPANELKTIRQTYFYPHKSYIVVGGMGGLGLEVVQWMAERGARHIVVSSRRGVVNSFQQWAIKRLDQRNIKLVISSADSTTEEGAIELISEAHKLGAVGGIINSAAVLNDTLFEDLSPDSFDNVATPKAKTTYFLDKISREYCPELDLFICFSSISNNRGNPGQSNYNFGNSAMEAVCRKRRKDGLHALAVEWGIIGDVGLVMEMGGYNGTVILSSKTQRVESCLDILDKFIQGKDTVVVSYVKSYATNDEITSETDLLKLLHRTLGFTDGSSVDKNASLSSLGLDSLMAVELQQIVERIKGVTLTIKAIRDMTINDFMELAKPSENQS